MTNNHHKDVQWWCSSHYFTLLIPPIKCLVVLVGELDAINLTMTTQILLLYWKLFKSTQFSVTVISALSAWLIVGTDIKLVITTHEYRAIFVWLWNENAWTKQNNRKRAIWLVYQTDTNTRGLWLVKRTFVWKNFMPENFLGINRYFVLTSYFNMNGQSNNAFSILGFSLAGKWRVHVLIFSSIGWYNK